MNQLLIIEDEAVIRGALRRLLERHGHHVSEAESVEAAQQQGVLAGVVVEAALEGAEDATRVEGGDDGGAGRRLWRWSQIRTPAG